VARRRVRDRENLRFERTRLFGRVRAIFREIGARFEADGVLPRAEDIFYLELGEILGVFDGTSSVSGLAAIAEVRRAEFEGHRRDAAPPDRFATRGPLYRHRVWEASGDVASGEAGEERHGLGASPGRVRGRCRVVLDPRLARFEPGEILVARQTDPGWVMLFPVASGLVVERGSLLSHSAIVSRELRLPCVVGVSGVCDWLADGDEVELDGAAGWVRRVAR
jgi:pyruvate,water dikinase